MDMDEIRTSAPESALNPGKWMGQLVAAVILAEGIWGFLASLTSNVLIPLFARVMDGDPQSPSYLGKGELNIPALFNSFLALCLAGIVSAPLYGWSRRKATLVRLKTKQGIQNVSQAATGPISIAASPEPIATSTPTTVTPSPASQIQQASVSTPPMLAPQQSKPTPPVVVVPSKPEKPKAPKEVYYNLVGDPIEPPDDDRSR